MATNKLKDMQISKLKPADNPFKITDGDGLFLLVHPNGGKYWRMSYRFGGKQKTLALGTYPDVSLAMAREARTEARGKLARGVDPATAKKEEQAIQAEIQEVQARADAGLPVIDSFEDVAREWFVKFSPGLVKSHSDKIIRRLERDIFPWVGQYDIGELKAHQMLNVVRKIEERGAIETAHRAMQNCSQVFRYGVATGRCERDPMPDLKGAIPPAKPTHHASIIEPQAIGVLLRAIDSYKGFYVVRAALKLAPLTFVRPGELRHAEWSEINLDAAEWNIPAVKMKMREPHLVPLSKWRVGNNVGDMDCCIGDISWSNCCRTGAKMDRTYQRS